MRFVTMRPIVRNVRRLPKPNAFVASNRRLSSAVKSTGIAVKSATSFSHVKRTSANGNVTRATAAIVHSVSISRAFVASKFSLRPPAIDSCVRVAAQLA